MNTFGKRVAVAAVAAVLTPGWSATVCAQDIGGGVAQFPGMNRLVNLPNVAGGPIGVPGSGGGGWGWGGGLFVQNPYEGYLNGGAAVIQAQAQFMIATQQAQLMKEKVKQERQDTRRRILDEWLYERANIPSLEQIRQESIRLQLSRSRYDPPVGEIMSGQALNSLLASLTRQINNVPAIELDQELLKNINVVPPIPGGGNFGLLRDREPLVWPLALQGLPPADQSTEARTQVDTLVAEAIKQAGDGRQVDAAVLRGIQANADKLEGMLRAQISNIPFTQYMDAKRFLSDLSDAQKILQMRNASNFVNGTYSARGRTVADLVRNMQGLQFAPASPGDERAYLALQQAMAQADMATAGLVANPNPPQ
jgi:hypothetical protein